VFSAELSLWSHLKDFPGRLLFYQDGAPHDYYLDVRGFLDEQLPASLIGHGGPTPWPPRSPDLSPFDVVFRVSSKITSTNHQLHSL
jgi:hypothetical protein